MVPSSTTAFGGHWLGRETSFDVVTVWAGGELALADVEHSLHRRIAFAIGVITYYCIH
jgi:hypothetical protein